MAHRNEGVPGGYYFSAIDVECSKFGLGGGRHDGFYYLGNREGGAVVRGVVQIVGHEEVGAGAIS